MGLEDAGFGDDAVTTVVEVRISLTTARYASLGRGRPRNER
jgi:hypothetical protein